MVPKDRIWSAIDDCRTSRTSTLVACPPLWPNPRLPDSSSLSKPHPVINIVRMNAVTLNDAIFFNVLCSALVCSAISYFAQIRDFYWPMNALLHHLISGYPILQNFYKLLQVYLPLHKTIIPRNSDYFLKWTIKAICKVWFQDKLSFYKALKCWIFCSLSLTPDRFASQPCELPIYYL